MKCSCVVDLDYDGESCYEGDAKAIPTAGTKCEACEKVFNGKEIAQNYYSGEEEEEDGDTTIKHRVDYYLCPDCQAVVDAFFCGSYTFSSIWEDLHDSLMETIDGQLRYNYEEEVIPWNKIAKLPKVAKGKVLAMIEELYEEGEANLAALQAQE